MVEMVKEKTLMPNIAKVLKDEIQRLARREIKASTDSLRKDNVVLKRTVADLKRRLAQLETSNIRIVAQAETAGPEKPDVNPNKARITGKMIRSIRSRLGISQIDFAKLVGVSGQTVLMWEHKDSRLDLRGNNKAAIVGIRKLGKRKVKKMLEEA